MVICFSYISRIKVSDMLLTNGVLPNFGENDPFKKIVRVISGFDFNMKLVTNFKQLAKES